MDNVNVSLSLQEWLLIMKCVQSATMIHEGVDRIVYASEPGQQTQILRELRDKIELGIILATKK